MTELKEVNEAKKIKETKLELSGMHCESCEKLIQRVAEKNSVAVKSIDARAGYLVLECEEDKLGSIKQQLAEKGFTEKKNWTGSITGDKTQNSGPETSPGRGDPERVKKYVYSIISGEPEFAVETKLFNYSVGSVIGLTALFLFGYKFAFSQLLGRVVPNFNAYLPLVFLSLLSSAVISGAYSHMRAYRKNISCMNGMMVGMTIGMISGFMVGALIGATNGLFIGSAAGIFVGMFLGVKVGKCCGIMGAMEGAMAGFMTGIMGAMTSIMLIRDNLVLFLYISFGVCALILGGLSYLMYRESESTAPKADFGTGFWDFFINCAVFALLLAGIMIFGPKALLVYS